ncbi:unnamed protein product [Adineta steineri]|uniref:RING-type domain-containing protein n=1 Tax=Adineta steineri TaxID=433720 RepID=A0A815BK40_9BILA|nr:unnamed protein product [Adineta steineri]
MTSTIQESFYLHSFRNRRLYPISDYPITHSLDRLNIRRRLLKQRIYIEHFLYAFIFLLLWTAIGAFFFQLHVQVYNVVFGPFHFNQKQFVQYVNQYKSEQSFFSQFGRIEYIQVELNEDNIQNSISKYDTIRRYSNPRTRDNHIATYKKIKHPKIYVKLPTNSQKYFHVHHPIHFQSYSIQTLQCIVRNLPLHSAYTYRTWTEKSEYIQYINKEYAKNSTEFNKAVLTKCGVLIGYLYRPLYERAFTDRGEHTFTSNDIALSMTDNYYSFYLFLFCGLIFIWLKLFHPLGIWSLSLKLSPDIIEELWLLNVDGSPHQQLLELDRLIKKSSCNYTKNLVIIRNDSDQLFVVILKMNANEGLNPYDESSPFIVCPVNDIRKITHVNGICYGKDSSWIRWPVTATDDNGYANWLHDQLLEISDVYKQRNDSDQLFVVILKINANEGLNPYDESSPFIVCPVNDIRKITHVNGICYGKDSSWIRWPVTATDDNGYANWLHDQLLEISDVYKQRHEQRLRHESDNKPLQQRHGTQFLRFDNIKHRDNRKRRSRVNTTITHNSHLSTLIHEENNIQLFKIERQSTTENVRNLLVPDPTSPATAQFIAQFRFEHEHNQQVVNMNMMNDQIMCTLCLENLKINEFYARWPCPGAHLFHYDCMLKSLRDRNTCPNCRHEVEGIPTESLRTTINRSLYRLFA